MYTINGAIGSPYSMKIRALIRYRRIPHLWVHSLDSRDALTKVKAPVIPVMEYPEVSSRNDFTPFIYDLEARHGERSIINGWLKQVGEIYMPFLFANAAAIEAGEEAFSITAMGLPYTQGVFKYQVQCLADLRARYAALDSAALAKVDPLLEETWCLVALV